MPTEHPSSPFGQVRSDIAFVKAMVQDDMNLPPRDWIIMIVAGAIFGAMGVRAWLMSAGLWTAPAAWRPWMLLDAPALFVLSLVLVFKLYPAGPQGLLSRTISAAWSAVGVGVGAMGMAFAVASWRAQNVDVMGLFTPMLFILYGMAWWIGYRVRLQAPLKWVAFGSFATASATALLVGRPELWLAEATGLLLFALIPGVVGLRLSRKAKEQ